MLFFRDSTLLGLIERTHLFGGFIPIIILLPRADWLARKFKTKKALDVSKVSVAEALKHYFGELDE